jgi:hypothetical protein
MPIPGIIQRTSNIAARTTNVLKQVEFVRRHSARDDVSRHVSKIVEMVEANTVEVNALLRSVLDRITDEYD